LLEEIRAITPETSISAGIRELIQHKASTKIRTIAIIAAATASLNTLEK